MHTNTHTHTLTVHSLLPPPTFARVCYNFLTSDLCTHSLLPPPPLLHFYVRAMKSLLPIRAHKHTHTQTVHSLLPPPTFARVCYNFLTSDLCTHSLLPPPPLLHFYVRAISSLLPTRAHTHTIHTLATSAATGRHMLYFPYFRLVHAHSIHTLPNSAAAACTKMCYSFLTYFRLVHAHYTIPTSARRHLHVRAVSSLLPTRTPHTTIYTPYF